jgi:hypothetical protein
MGNNENKHILLLELFIDLNDLKFECKIRVN